MNPDSLNSFRGISCLRDLATIKSVLICRVWMTREEALEAMKDDSDYTEAQMMEDKEYILKKLDISDSEWEGIMKGQKKTEDMYHSRKKMLAFLRMVKRKIKVLKG